MGFNSGFKGLSIKEDQCVFSNHQGMSLMFYAFYWVIPRRLNFVCRRFETLCLFHLYRWVGTYPLMKMEQTECSEALAYKIQTPGNYPEESIQHSEQVGSLKSRKNITTTKSICITFSL